MKVAVLVPSRGLVLSRGAEALDSELVGVESVRLYEHDKGIPDAFNSLTRRFLETDADVAWIVEEDIVVPNGSLTAMAESGADIAAVDYWLRLDTPIMSHRYHNEMLHWVSLGCTLIWRRVFERIAPPWFRSDLVPQLVHSGSASNWREEIRPRNANVYGGQDVYFCAVARMAGFRLAVAGEGRLLAEHWKMICQSQPEALFLAEIQPVGCSGRVGNMNPSGANQARS